METDKEIPPSSLAAGTPPQDGTSHPNEELPPPSVPSDQTRHNPRDVNRSTPISHAKTTRDPGQREEVVGPLRPRHPSPTLPPDPVGDGTRRRNDSMRRVAAQGPRVRTTPTRNSGGSPDLVEVVTSVGQTEPSVPPAFSDGDGTVAGVVREPCDRRRPDPKTLDVFPTPCVSQRPTTLVPDTVASWSVPPGLWNLQDVLVSSGPTVLDEDTVWSTTVSPGRDYFHSLYTRGN